MELIALDVGRGTLSGTRARGVRSAWRTARVRGFFSSGTGLTKEREAVGLFVILKAARTVTKFTPHTSRKEPLRALRLRPGAGVDTSSIMAPAEWTRQEQQLLQAALRQNPPSMENTARWEAIAAAVPGRGPQECLDQCRVLAAAVKGASSADEAKARFKLAKQNAEDARVAAVANRERAAQEKAARAAREQEEAAAAKARASDRGPRWWTRALASEVDPISLEPLRSLHYPPYECRADTSVTHQTGSDWFDGLGLG